MGIRHEDLPEPGSTLDTLLHIDTETDKKSGETITVGPMLRFVGSEVFATDQAIKAIPTTEPRNPKPRDLWITTGEQEMRLPNGDTFPGQFYKRKVLVKYYVRTTGAPIKETKDEDGRVIYAERVKEFEVYRKEYLLKQVRGDRA